MTISQNELLDALAAALPGSTAPEDARTVSELRADLGWGVERLRRALGVLQAQGRLAVHRVRRPDLTGRLALVPAYTILPKAPKGKR